jgi:xyloglucan fucosyltransferase
LYRGLGNRILAAALAFLYIVLTDCVLVDLSIEMDKLFCDPFLCTTWLLLWDFPS